MTSVSNTDIENFKTIYKEKFGIALSDEDAKTLSSQLINLSKNILSANHGNNDSKS